MTDQPVAAVALAFGSISATPAWTQLIVPSADRGGALWGFLRVRNTTDVRIEGSFDGSNGHFLIDAGEKDEWNITKDVVSGTVFIRGATANPTSGDVTADGLV